VEAKALSQLLRQFKDKIQCVFLNSCYSAAKAEEIAKNVESVIGMKYSIDDNTAISFAIGFYQAVAAGRSVEEAFELGRAQVSMHSINESDNPVLLSKPDSMGK